MLGGPVLRSQALKHIKPVYFLCGSHPIEVITRREPYCERNCPRANSEPSSNHPSPLGLAGGNACDVEFAPYPLKIGSQFAGNGIPLHAILLKCPPNHPF
jgi:hypothetical protein